MPKGLCNSSFTFQRLMVSIFPQDKLEFVHPYLEDLIILSKIELVSTKHLEKILKTPQKANSCLNKGIWRFKKNRTLVIRE